MGLERLEQTDERRQAAFWPDTPTRRKKYCIDPRFLSSLADLPSHKHTSGANLSRALCVCVWVCCIWDSVTVRSFSIGFVGWGSSPEQQPTNPVPCVWTCVWTKVTGRTTGGIQRQQGRCRWKKPLQYRSYIKPSVYILLSFKFPLQSEMGFSSRSYSWVCVTFVLKFNTRGLFLHANAKANLLCAQWKSDLKRHRW